jgi:FtsH-binding integral membrane protein
VAPGEATATAAPTWQQRLGWVGLALVPSGLVTAFTVHVTTDVASAPLLWVIPLALYLLTFVLVFRDRPLISREALLFLHLVALVVALITLSQTRHDNWFVTSSTGVAAFFTAAMLAHRTLYEARPAARYLTEFYLWMSLGGALGGMFAALLAPKLFNQIYEYPILLALSMACRPGALNFSRDNKSKDEIIILWLILAVGVLAIAWLPTRVPGRHPARQRALSAAAAAGGRPHVHSPDMAALGRAARRVAEELLRRLPCADIGRWCLPHPDPRHHAAWRAAVPG